MIPILAAIAAAVFTGAALLVSVAEQPARLALDDGAMLTGLLGIVAWWQTGQMLQVIGAALILACWPFVLLVVMPVNNQLRTIAPGDGARALVVRWGRLHNVRTLLGAAATVALVLAL